jgi:putative alpha-1,2-mannosidase
MPEKKTEVSNGPDRREFLKTSALTAAAAMLGTQPAIAATAHVAEKAQRSGSAQSERAVDLVNVLLGADSTHAFSRGNTLPIAAVPFGMAHWTLQSESRTPWMFQLAARRLQGFRCTHQLSPWLSDYGQAYSCHSQAIPSSIQTQSVLRGGPRTRYCARTPSSFR